MLIVRIGLLRWYSRPANIRAKPPKGGQAVVSRHTAVVGATPAFSNLAILRPIKAN